MRRKKEVYKILVPETKKLDVRSLFEPYDIQRVDGLFYYIKNLPDKKESDKIRKILNKHKIKPKRYSLLDYLYFAAVISGFVAIGLILFL